MTTDSTVSFGSSSGSSPNAGNSLTLPSRSADVAVGDVNAGDRRVGGEAPGPAEGESSVKVTIALDQNHDFPEARLGQPSVIALGVEAQFGAKVTSVRLEVTYPGQPVIKVPATMRAGQRVAIVRFPQPGAVTLVAKATWTEDGNDAANESESPPLAANVLPANRHPLIRVQLDGQSATEAGPGPALPVAAAGSAIVLSIWTDADRNIRSMVAHVEVDGQALPEVALAISGGDELELAWTNAQALLLPAGAAPRPVSGSKPAPTLIIFETDFFGHVTTTSYAFKTLDITPPVIQIESPKEGQLFIVEAGDLQQFKLKVSGWVEDLQSGMTGSISCTGGESEINIPVGPGVGRFPFDIDIPLIEYSKYALDFAAKDISNNQTAPQSCVRNITIVPAFVARTYEELTSPLAYLTSLIEFAIARLKSDKKGSDGAALPVTLPEIRQHFRQDFTRWRSSRLGQPEAACNELLVPVRLLHLARRARYTFSELRSSARPSVLEERAASAAGLNGRYVGLTATVPSKEPGFQLDKSVGAVVEGLTLGDDRGDYTIAFWLKIPPLNGADDVNEFTSLIFKGDAQKPADRRGPAIFLQSAEQQTGYQLHFGVTTSKNSNFNGTSPNLLPRGQWLHVALSVRADESIQLFVDGVLDTQIEVPQGEIVTAQSDPLYIGTAGLTQGARATVAELGIHARALGLADVNWLMRQGLSGIDESAHAHYHEAAYEAVLRGLGTSFETVRGLRALSAAGRRQLAQRLGLQEPGAAGRDSLDLLRPPEDATPGSAACDLWLSDDFGVPRPSLIEQTPPPVPKVLAAQQACLSLTWLVEDSVRSRPDLDPDLVDLDDLAEDAAQLRQWLVTRSTYLGEKFDEYREAARGDIVATLEGFIDNPDRTLTALEAREAAGENISSDLLAMQLSVAMFRRLLAFLEIARSGGVLSLHEREDFAHLLTQWFKLRDQYTQWVNEEQRQLQRRPWPLLGLAAGWNPGHRRRNFAPWRGDVQSRIDLESRIEDRIERWRDLEVSMRASTLEAQRSSLPALRDALIALPPESNPGDVVNDLGERWLADVAGSGALTIDPVAQATQSLQALIEGVRAKRFEDGVHPAKDWAIQDEGRFDEEWRRIATFGDWRNAVLNYLYPENALYPELLRKTRQDGSLMFPKIVKFVGELAAQQPFRIDSLSDGKPLKASLDAATDPNTAEGTAAGTYFANLAVGLALQRSEQFALALDWYRKIFDWSKPKGFRALVNWIFWGEGNGAPPSPDFAFAGQSNWLTSLDDPHSTAISSVVEPGLRLNVRWGRPYTRFVIFQVLECLLAQADDAFAAGSSESRGRASSLYLEAQDVLGLDEAQDPQVSGQDFIPSPVLAAYRSHVESALFRLRSGLTFLGTPMPAEVGAGSSSDAISTIVRPTPYRYKALLERARQQTALAQQIEGQYLAAMERQDNELDRLMAAGFAESTAEKSVQIRSRAVAESMDTKQVAVEQQSRARLLAERYQSWIDSGATALENRQVEMMWNAKTARDVIAGYDAVIAGTQALAANLISGAIVSGAEWQKAISQGFLNYYETRAQVDGIYAAQERRTQEWSLRADESRQDEIIARQQVVAADDRIAISQLDLGIAQSQQAQAAQTLAFLQEKFTSADFYGWLAGTLGRIYANLLRTATTTARQAEQQLAFERQKPSTGLIRADYWRTSPSIGPANASADRRGMTGSAQLLQDLQALDQQAFSSEQRLLNLSQSFSLARLMPIEFEAFRRTGGLAFTTPMPWFDEGFPGHYLRLIRRVRISLAALLPPSLGIRATLFNTGISRVVTSDPGYPTTILRQDPQMVALTAPTGATGVFELDMQPDLLMPFEGSGVDTSWIFELPRAGNPFDFESLFDLVVTIDYTALLSSELRDRVVRKLPSSLGGTRVISVRRDLPDVWYALTNAAAGEATPVPVGLSWRDFPPGLSNVRVTELSLTLRRLDRGACEFNATWHANLTDGTSASGIAAGSIDGVVSTRRSSSWRPLHTEDVSSADWTFELADMAGRPSILQQFREGQIEDIMIAQTFEGNRPAWT